MLASNAEPVQFWEPPAQRHKAGLPMTRREATGSVTPTLLDDTSAQPRREADGDVTPTLEIEAVEQAANALAEGK